MILKSSLSQSILNAYIQQSVDAEGSVDWSKMPDVLKSDAQISGIGRGGETSSHAEEYEQNRNSVGLKSIMDAAIEAIEKQNTVSEWLELVITKEECSIAEAYAILNLTLVGEVNSTIGELGYISEYDSVYRSAPELMNLTGDSLQLIPLKKMYYILMFFPMEKNLRYSIRNICFFIDT